MAVWHVKALCTLVDRQRTRGARRIGLRDAALLTLRAAGFSVSELHLARGRDLQQDASGRLFVWVSDAGGRRRAQRVTVPTASLEFVHGVLLPFMEAEGLWDRPRPLFAGRNGKALSRSALRKIERWYRSRVGQQQ